MYWSKFEGYFILIRLAFVQLVFLTKERDVQTKIVRVILAGNSVCSETEIPGGARLRDHSSVRFDL